MLRLCLAAGRNRGGNGGQVRADDRSPRHTLGRFVYGKSYLARKDAVPLDPVELTLGTRVFETTALNGVFGSLRDSGPTMGPARHRAAPEEIHLDS